MFNQEYRLIYYCVSVVVFVRECLSSDLGTEQCQNVAHATLGSAFLQRPGPSQFASPPFGMQSMDATEANVLNLPAFTPGFQVASMPGAVPVNAPQESISFGTPGQVSADVSNVNTLPMNPNLGGVLDPQQLAQAGIATAPLLEMIPINANLQNLPAPRQPAQASISAYRASAEDAIMTANKWKDAAANLSIQLESERQHSQALANIASERAEALAQESSKALEFEGKLMQVRDELDLAKKRLAVSEQDTRDVKAAAVEQVERAFLQERQQEEFARKLQVDSELRLENLRSQASNRIHEAQLETWRVQRESALAVKEIQESAEAALAHARLPLQANLRASVPNSLATTQDIEAA